MLLLQPFGFLANKDEVIAEIMASHVQLKKSLGERLKDSWAEPDIRDEVVDYVRYWSCRTEIKAGKIVNHIDITRSKYYDWRRRYGWHVLLPVQYIGWLQPQSQKAGIMMKRKVDNNKRTDKNTISWRNGSRHCRGATCQG